MDLFSLIPMVGETCGFLGWKLGRGSSSWGLRLQPQHHSQSSASERRLEQHGEEEGPSPIQTAAKKAVEEKKRGRKKTWLGRLEATEAVEAEAKTD